MLLHGITFRVYWKCPGPFFFLKIVVTVQPAITFIYSEDWLLQKKAANSIHIMNTGKKEKKKKTTGNIGITPIYFATTVLHL